MNTVAKWMALGGCLVLSACGGGGGDDGYTVTASAGAGGAISPSGAVTVASGKSGVFTLTPSAGYGLSAVEGSCGGTLSGNTYTTKPMSADCTVQAKFANLQAAIAACFTVPKAVSFSLGFYNTNGKILVGGGSIARSVGPATFNGQTATESKSTSSFASSNGLVSSSNSMYWAVTDTGVSMLGVKYNDGTTYTPNPAVVIPLNMPPGKPVNFASAKVFNIGLDGPASYTFIGLETLTLTNKVFSNVCHFQLQGIPAGFTDTWTYDSWYAPGAGEIKSEYPSYSDPTDIGGLQYSGGL